MAHYISEDDKMMYNRWVQGIASRDLKGSNIMLSDLLQQADNQNYTNSDIGQPDVQLPKTLPYPLSTIYDDLAGFVIAYSNIVEKLKKGASNVATKDADKKKYELVIDNLKQIELVIKNTVSLLDKTVEKPRK